MEKEKKTVILGFTMGVVFLLNTLIFYSNRRTGLTILFLIFALIEFGTAIYYIVKMKKQGTESEGE